MLMTYWPLILILKNVTDLFLLKTVANLHALSVCIKNENVKAKHLMICSFSFPMCYSEPDKRRPGAIISHLANLVLLGGVISFASFQLGWVSLEII